MLLYDIYNNLMLHTKNVDIISITIAWNLYQMYGR